VSWFERPASVLLARLITIGLAGAGVSAFALAEPRGCEPGEQPVAVAQLFFGRDIAGRPGVSDAQFDTFVDQVLTRRFPNGLTRVSAVGQWREANAPTTRERADVVTLVLPDDPASRAGLEAVRRDYIVRFRQSSVLMTRQPACMRV
jgi:hypothetical protein